MSLLQVRQLGRRFGGLWAVQDLSFDIAEGEVVGMIGPNGSGKTTVFNLVTGIYRPTAGEIRFDGRRVDGLASHRVAQAGVSRTFQTIRLFQNLTVLENVMVGMHRRLPSSLEDIFLSWREDGGERSRAREAARELLGFTDLADKAAETASSLSYGEQRRLELARALAGSPRLLLLDEPTAGMNPQESLAMMRIIEKTLARRVTIFLVEHNMKVLMGVSRRVIVLDAGEKIAEGEPHAIQRDPLVIKAYLGAE